MVLSHLTEQTEGDRQRQFGALLAGLREAAGWKNASRFAKAVGLSSNAMHDLEKGKRIPKPETVELIVDALNKAFTQRGEARRVNFAEMLRLSGNIVPDNQTAGAAVSPFATEVLGLCQNVPEAAQEYVLRLLRDAVGLFGVAANLGGHTAPERELTPEEREDEWIDNRIKELMSRFPRSRKAAAVNKFEQQLAADLRENERPDFPVPITKADAS